MHNASVLLVTRVLVTSSETDVKILHLNLVFNQRYSSNLFHQRQLLVQEMCDNHTPGKAGNLDLNLNVG
jgi:hypothetical protein